MLINVHQERLIHNFLHMNPGLDPSRVSLIAQNSGIFREYETGEIDTGQFFTALCNTFEFNISRDEFKRIWQNIFTPIDPMIRLIPRLANRYQLVILSNTNPLHIEFCELQYEFLKSFTHRLYSYNLGLMKPDPEIYKYALKTAGALPETCLFIDDRPENVEAAEKLGIIGAHYTGFESFMEKWGRSLLDQDRHSKGNIMGYCT